MSAFVVGRLITTDNPPGWKPKILFMDEGTSSLDVETERRVSARIQGLGLTRIVIAHRPETIATAERRLVMDGAGVVEQEVPSNQARAVAVLTSMVA